MAPRKVTKDHFYFSDLESLEVELAQRAASRPLAGTTPLGSFNGTRTGMQGYVWSGDWIVGVWVEMEGDKSTNVVFWTVRSGKLDIWEDDVTWSRNEIVERAGVWLESLVRSAE